MRKPATFDRLARIYQPLEYVTMGPLLQGVRTHFLPEVIGCRQALVMGDGDGRFLAELLAQSPAMEADAVDSSGAMLAELRRRCLGAAPSCAQRLRTHKQDARSYDPQGRPDLVVTHFFLDCLTEPEIDGLVRRTVPLLTPGALWLVSEFRVPETGVMRLFGAVLVRSLYLIFRILTGLRVTRLPAFDRSFRRAGMECVGKHRRMFGLLTAELWRCQERSGLEYP